MVENKKKSVSKNNVEQRKEPSNNTNKNAGNCWLPITIGQLPLQLRICQLQLQLLV